MTAGTSGVGGETGGGGVAEPKADRPSTSIYFRNPKILERLQTLSTKLGISVSVIMESIAGACLPELEAKGPSLRRISIKTVIKL